jgi:hypothetical protein
MVVFGFLHFFENLYDGARTSKLPLPNAHILRETCFLYIVEVCSIYIYRRTHREYMYTILFQWHTGSHCPCFTLWPDCLHQPAPVGSSLSSALSLRVVVCPFLCKGRRSCASLCSVSRPSIFSPCCLAALPGVCSVSLSLSLPLTPQVRIHLTSAWQPCLYVHVIIVPCVRFHPKACPNLALVHAPLSVYL